MVYLRLCAALMCFGLLFFSKEGFSQITCDQGIILCVLEHPNSELRARIEGLTEGYAKSHSISEADALSPAIKYALVLYNNKHFLSPDLRIIKEKNALSRWMETMVAYELSFWSFGKELNAHIKKIHERGSFNESDAVLFESLERKRSEYLSGLLSAHEAFLHFYLLILKRDCVNSSSIMLSAQCENEIQRYKRMSGSDISHTFLQGFSNFFALQALKNDGRWVY
ncbi:MAG: hypothetical protein Q8R36_03635 [bacterium]|nr:hypothetical protein [bacterium]